MNYYDYDYEIEPNYPEVEEIIENATDEFSKFLHNAFVDEYKSIETAKQNNTTKEKTLNECSIALDKREYELEKREVEIAKIEEAQYEKAKIKWFATLGLNFDIGDTVYYLKDISEFIDCPMCSRAGRVKAKIKDVEHEVVCPTCKGNCRIQGEKQIKVVEAKVKEINVSICKREDYISVKYMNNWKDLLTYVRVEDKEDNCSQIIDGKRLYKTKEESESHIAELNGE